MGKGALPFEHPLHLGVAGVWGDYPATEACRHADVILAIGARFNDLHTGSWIPGYVYNIPPTKLIQVDIDANEIGRNYPVEIGITGDAKAFLGQALKIAQGKQLRLKSGEAWRQQIQGWQSEWRNFCEPFERSDEVPIEPRRMLADMNRISPPDTVMVDDIGNCQVWSEQYWQTRIPGHHMTSGGFAAMGFGVCGVLGARLARPDSPCVTLCGDGGFMMCPHAVATAVEYNLPAVWVVQNNYAIGTIRDLQRVYLDGRELGTSFVNEQTGQLWNPDFVAMANAMGGRGIRIEHPDQFGDAYAEAIRSNVPTVLDVVINRDTGIPVTGTWQMPPIPKSSPHSASAPCATRAHAQNNRTDPAAMQKTVADPGAVTWKVGEIEVTALADGYVMLPASFVLIGEKDAELRTRLAELTSDDGKVRLDVNTFLVRTGADTLLIDTGASTSWDDTMGALPASMARIGLRPAEITQIALTHTHRDHLNGLLLDGGEPAFPALERLFVAAEEESRIRERDDLAYCHPMLVPVRDGDVVVPGVTALSAHGHSAGHTCYRVSSGEETLLIWGDIVHVAEIQFADPRIAWQYDEDQTQAVETRLRVLDRVLDGGWSVAGAHIPFPGVLRLSRAEGRILAEKHPA